MGLKKENSVKTLTFRSFYAILISLRGIQKLVVEFVLIFRNFSGYFRYICQIMYGCGSLGPHLRVRLPAHETYCFVRSMRSKLHPPDVLPQKITNVKFLCFSRTGQLCFEIEEM